MENQSKGIHHISIISGDGQRNADFYVNVLGLRMVMKTVNQDDTGHYHLFYANGQAQPGSSITFFPWPMAHQGKPGSGQATIVSFAVPVGSMEFWAEHLGSNDIDFEGPYERFGKKVIGFKDPDRLQLELVFDSDVDNIPGWTDNVIPEEYGIRGFWGTTMKLEETEATAGIIEHILGFEKNQTGDNAAVYQTNSSIGRNVILERVKPQNGKNGRGIIHHVAFRTADKEEQKAMRQQVIEYGLHPTEVIDRDFFFSVYFRSPGGVLFEIATDGPGYSSVQNKEDMGKKLYLPDWIEPKRDTIEKGLPEITL
jgi:glyoxalase family protein